MNKRLSKFLSLILRHKPETVGISLDEHGWADVGELLEGIRKTGKNIDLSMLERRTTSKGFPSARTEKGYEPIRGIQCRWT